MHRLIGLLVFLLGLSSWAHAADTTPHITPLTPSSNDTIQTEPDSIPDSSVSDDDANETDNLDSSGSGDEADPSNDSDQEAFDTPSHAT